MAHQVKDAAVRLRVLDGTWETAGTDRASGIVVQGLELDWDTWGPKAASFDLKRSPNSPWPDLAAFTDVEIDVGGVQVWKGRVRETPTRDGADQSMNVQCEGMQAHLDDDLLVPAYVHTRLSDYKDTRSFVDTILTRFKTNGSVQASDGAIVLGFPNGASVTTGDAVGVTFDLGANASAKRMVLTFENQGVAAGTYSLYVVGTDTPADLIIGGENAIGALDPSSAGLTQAGSFSTARRYVTVLLYRGIGGTVTETIDRLVRVTGLQTFTDTAYESGNASTLKASQVVTDALARGTILLSPDRSLVSTTSFSIPDFFTLEQRTPRETIEAANGYHDYVTKVDEQGRAVFAAKPASPLLEVGEFTALETASSSQNSGTDIYNRCIVTGQASTGEPVTVERSASQQVGAVVLPLSSPVIANPSFAVNTSSWSSGGTGVSFTRDTVVFDSSPAAAKLISSSKIAVCYATTTVTGLFQAGRTYILAFRAKSSCDGATASFGSTTVPLVSTGAWSDNSVSWTPAVDTTNAAFTVSGSRWFFSTYSIYFDTLKLSVSAATLADRRGFRRAKELRVNSPLDISGAIGTQLADTYLANHKLAQFKGEAKITGPVREILTGRNVPPEQLGMRTQQLLRFNDRIDPDTGAVGRDGRIAAVKYSLDRDEATVSVDNTSQSFEALLSRLAVISGAGK